MQLYNKYNDTAISSKTLLFWAWQLAWYIEVLQYTYIYRDIRNNLEPQYSLLGNVCSNRVYLKLS